MYTQYIPTFILSAPPFSTFPDAPLPASPGFTEHALAADLLAGSMRHERQGTGHHNLRTLPRSYLAGYRATH